MLASLSRALRRSVTRQRFLLALSLWCLSQAAILLLHNNFRQLTGQSVLDLRAEGYQEGDVKQLLHSAGPKGRQLYLYISLIDLGVYMWSYAFLLSGLLTMASAVAPAEFFKYLNLLPCLAVSFDVAENLLVLSMLISYPSVVDVAAPIVAQVSKCKWHLLYLCACVVGGAGFYCVTVAAGLTGKGRKSKRSSSSTAEGTSTSTPKQHKLSHQTSRKQA